MSLKTLVASRIMTDIFRSLHQPGEWKILVVDQLAMRVISSCCKMHEITEEGITLVEDLAKTREPLPNLEAIYFITPNNESISLLERDFEDSPLYKAAHIFFTGNCPLDSFTQLSESPAAKYIKTMKEVNMSFFPYESQVYTVDSGAGSESQMERYAEQLATLCATLDECPAVRYRLGNEKNAELAARVQEKLDSYKKLQPSMGQGPEKAGSKLLIIDRDFDCMSPLLHELTLQAMVYDLLPVQNDVYKTEDQKEVYLDENDEIWAQLRHKHIADASQRITNLWRDLEKLSGTDKSNMKDLSQMIKKLPKYQKKKSLYATHLSLASSCVDIYKDEIKELCRVEQNMALGVDENGEKVGNWQKSIGPILMDPYVKTPDKLRVFLLYVLLNNGVNEEIISSVIKHAEIPESEQSILTNMNDIASKKKTYQGRRKERLNEETYSTSRWTPIIKDIMEDAIQDKLDSKHFSFSDGHGGNSGSNRSVPTSLRHGHQNKKTSPGGSRNVPRLIVFILGGVTFSEMRSAYEVANENNSWDVIIGSDRILTPTTFLESLRNVDN